MKSQHWRLEVLEGETQNVLNDLARLPALSDFYLAGGTGLALQLGHRRSIDLDFFTTSEFSEEQLIIRIQKLGGFSVTARAAGTLHTHIRGVKVTFLRYEYPVLFPFQRFDGVAVADVRDIGCMKVSAIAGRGTRRDFVDVFTVCAQYPLRELLQLFEKKYRQANYSAVHLLKSLTYFDDAEKEPMPNLLAAVNWNEVKAFFVGEAKRLAES